MIMMKKKNCLEVMCLGSLPRKKTANGNIVLYTKTVRERERAVAVAVVTQPVAIENEELVPQLLFS